jgi:hypothetical protein
MIYDVRSSYRNIFSKNWKNVVNTQNKTIKSTNWKYNVDSSKNWKNVVNTHRTKPLKVSIGNILIL